MDAAALIQLVESQFPDVTEREQALFAKFSDQDLEQLYAYAYQLYLNGKYLESKHFFRFLTMLRALDRRFWIGLGACFQMLKQYQEAIECYSVAAVLQPDDPAVHRYAADCLFAMGRLSEALKALESALIVAKKCADQAAVQKLEVLQSAWQARNNGESI